MDEVTLRDYLKVIFRQKWAIVVTIITVTIVTALGLWIKTPVYEAQVKMLVSAQKGVESPYYRDLVGYQNIQVALTQSEIVKSTPVMERALKIIGPRGLDFEKKYASFPKKLFIGFRAFLTEKYFSWKKMNKQERDDTARRLELKALKNNTKVEPIRDTNLFVLSYKDLDPNAVATIANAISRSYVIFDLEQQLAELQIKYGEKNFSIIQLKESIAKMEQNLAGTALSNVEAIGPASVKIIEQATPPIKPEGLSKITILALAFFSSIFLGILLTFFLEYMEQTFRSPQDIEKILQIPFLGSISKTPNPEAFQHLAEQIYFEMKDRNVKIALVTSTFPKEGVSLAVTEIAKHLSRIKGHKILVIDANLRNPTIHKRFGLDNETGLAEVLEEKITFDKVRAEINSNLYILTAGKAELNPMVLIESKRMSDFFKSIKEKFDAIIIDSPNLRETKDALGLSISAEGVILMINEGKTRRQTAQCALEMLKRKMGKAIFIGAILGNRTFVLPKKIYERI
ncbi:MAG: Wzz/FepE/Etk N-terminal domain-containing protein [Candidatus Omnitrophota bacterium]